MKNKANIILTHSCNLKCKHCYMDAKPCLEDQNIVYKKAKKLIDTLKKDNFDTIMFTGGECMLFQKLENLIKYAKKKGFHVSIFTNGMIYNEKVFDIVDSINLSLDGPKDIHNMIRGSNKSFDNILKCLNYLKKKDIYTVIQTTINNMNYNQIEFLEELTINHLNIRNVKFVFTSYEGRAKENNIHADHKCIEYINDKIKILYDKTKYHIQFSTNLFNKYEFENYILKSDFIFPIWFDLIENKYYILNNNKIKSHNLCKYNIKYLQKDIAKINKCLKAINVFDNEYIDIESEIANL